MPNAQMMADAMGLTLAEYRRLTAEVDRLEAAQDVEDQQDEFRQIVDDYV